MSTESSREMPDAGHGSDEYARRLVVFSDIHANLAALDTFLEILDRRYAAADTICLGDIVGYGPSPNRCCERIRSRNIPTLLGNHDYAVRNPVHLPRFNEMARAAAIWTHHRLSRENSRFLDQLPLQIEVGPCLAVHASPDEPARWNYILGASSAERNFECFDQWVCFVGHSHIPAVFEMDPAGDVMEKPPEDMTLRATCRYIVNVGSIGQPRDGNVDLCFVVFDPESGRLKYERHPYERLPVQQAILQEGLPSEIALRLDAGR